VSKRTGKQPAKKGTISRALPNGGEARRPKKDRSEWNDIDYYTEILLYLPEDIALKAWTLLDETDRRLSEAQDREQKK